MPGSQTTPDRPGPRDDAPGRVAFRSANSVGIRDEPTFAARWLAYALPCRRFADVLTGADARLGVDVVRYSFIVVDLHHLLLAGLPALSATGQSTKSLRSSPLRGGKSREALQRGSPVRELRYSTSSIEVFSI